MGMIFNWSICISLKFNQISSQLRRQHSSQRLSLRIAFECQSRTGGTSQLQTRAGKKWMLCDDSPWNPAKGATLCLPNSLILKSILGRRIRCRCTCQAGRAGFRGDQICFDSRRKWRTSAHRNRHVPAEWRVQASGDWYAFSEKISTNNDQYRPHQQIKWMPSN